MQLVRGSCKEENHELENKCLDFEFDKKNGYYCLPQTHNNLYIVGLGYLNLEKETDFENFGENSFTEEPIYREVQFDEYYKLITAE